MAKTYEQLQAEIAALQQKAAAVREKEVAGVVQRIKDAISFYGLTAEDLGLNKSATSKNAGAVVASGAAKKEANPAKPTVSTIKYRDEAGHTWSGRGPKPGWFKEALSQGKSLEDLLA